MEEKATRVYLTTVKRDGDFAAMIGDTNVLTEGDVARYRQLPKGKSHEFKMVSQNGVATLKEEQLIKLIHDYEKQGMDKSAEAYKSGLRGILQMRRESNAAASPGHARTMSHH